MNPVTISEAASHIEALIALLDDAFWEASTIENKDLIYNVIHAVQSEYTEINKLSIQDHHLPYEPITQDFREMKHKFNALRNMMNSVIMRNSTAGALEQLMPKVTALTL